MINFRKAMKGISFLLCLGFFVYSGTAVAKTTYKDITEGEGYRNCVAAQNYIKNYDNAGDCEAIASEIKKHQEDIEGACVQFKSKSSEFKKCTSGQKTTIDETDIRTGKDAQPINARIEIINNVLRTISEKQQKLSTCESTRETALSNAKSALKACQSDQKASDKADKKAQEAAEKEAKAKAEYESAEATYNSCVASKGADNCNSEYKKYVKAAEAYNKKATKADAARDNQALAHEKSGMNGCTADEVWDGSKCIKDPKIEAAEKAEAERAAKQAELEANSEYQYAAAMCEAGQQEGCDRVNSMKAAAGLLAESDTSVAGEDVGNVTEGEIAAAKGYKDCMAAYPDGKLGEKSGSTYNIFKYIACRITAFVADLRGIVYALAGFGLIFCAYNAIMGKLSFKHLGTIATGLFILSMTTSFIEYIVFDGQDKLEFGEYLPDGNHGNYMHEVTGADFNGSNCGDDPSLCPDALLSGMESSTSGWDFWNDIGGTIDSIADGIGAITNAYSTVSNLYDSASSAISNIKDAINGENDQTRAAESDLNATREGLADAQQLLALAQQNLAPAQMAVNAAQSAYDAAVAQVNQDREDINAMQKALNSGDYSQYLSADTKATIDNAQKALDDANKAVEEQQASLAANQAKLDDLNDALNISKLEDQAASAEKGVAALQAQIDALDPSRPAQAAQIEQLKKAQAQAQAAADAIKERINNAKAKYGDKSPAELQAMIAEVKADIEDDKYLLKQKQDAVRSAQKDLTDANTAAKKEVQDLITAKNKELQSDQAALNDSQRALNQAKSEYNAAERDVTSAQNSVAAWEGAVAQAQANYDAAKEGAGDFLSNVGKVATNVAALTSNVSYTANSLANTASRVSNDVQNAGRSQSEREYYAQLEQTYTQLKSMCDKNPTLAAKCSANPKDIDCINHPDYIKCKDLATVEQKYNDSQNGVNKWLNNTGSGILNGLQNASNNANQARDGAGAVNQAYQQGKHQGDQVNGTLGSLFGAGKAIGEAVSQGTKAINGNKK